MNQDDSRRGTMIIASLRGRSTQVKRMSRMRNGNRHALGSLGLRPTRLPRGSLTRRRELVLAPITAPQIRMGHVGEGVRLSADKFDNERFLFGGLDSVATVVGADSSDRLAARIASQDSEAGQGRSGSPMAPEATDLHPLPSTSPLEHGSQGSDDVGRIIGDTQVRPVEVVEGPRRLPLVIKIKPPVVRWFVHGRRGPRHRKTRR